MLRSILRDPLEGRYETFSEPVVGMLLVALVTVLLGVIGVGLAYTVALFF